MINKIIELFNAGKLEEAIAESNQLVASNPRELPPRIILAQLVCFTGNWERAQKVIDQVKTLDASHEQAPLVNFLNAMVMAEIQRKQVWTEGALPEFVEAPGEVESKLLWAWNCRRSGEMDQYNEAMQYVMDNVPSCSLVMDSKNLEGLRDLDDMTAIILEAHSIHGAHYWLPINQITKLDVSPPTRPVDFLWNSARLTLQNGQEARMYLPGTYFHSYEDDNDEFRLGRSTQWNESADGGEVGVGRKIFVAGDDEEFTLFDFAEVEIKVA